MDRSYTKLNTQSRQRVFLAPTFPGNNVHVLWPAGFS